MQTVYNGKTKQVILINMANLDLSGLYGCVQTVHQAQTFLLAFFTR